MKFSFIVTYIFFFISFLNIYSQTSDEVKSIDSYDNDGLAAILFCGNFDFIEQWNKPKVPKITPLKSIRREEDLIPYIIFQTDAADEKGNAYLTYNIKLLNPDSSVYDEFNDLVLWKDSPVHNLHLVQQYIRIYIEEKDQLGVYTILVEIHDKIKNVTFPLSVNFSVL